MTQEKVEYEIGTRLRFLWPDRSHTPGTVSDYDARRGLITVSWDDGKTTKSSALFLKKYTRSC